MLRIAVVGNDYQHVLQFIRLKFKNKIDKVDAVKGLTYLINGDILYMCYDEIRREQWLSMEFDAFMVTPTYQSLLDLVIGRSGRI